MKKSVLLIVLCAFISAHGYEQIVQAKSELVTGPIKELEPANQVVNQAQTACKGKRIYLTKGGDNGIYVDGSSYSYNAGDTFVFNSNQNPYSYITMDYFTKGTNACPIVIINEGNSQVILTNYNGDAIPGGFSFTGSSHVKLTGTGTPGLKYGFKITTPDNRGLGVGIDGRSSNFEVNNLEIYNKGAGFWVKQEADCADSLQYPNWVMHDFKIHNNYIHNCQQEGMYLGSTDPNGTRAITCNGATVYPKPLRLGNFHIYNNTIDSTGRGGIQLSDADSGESEINNNTTSNIGYEFNIYQGNGIVLGGYTQAYVHNNTVYNTYSTGIYTLGAGLVKIKNNSVNYSGVLNGQTANGMASIMVDTRQTTFPEPGKPNPENLTFIVSNNLLGSNTDYNVRVYNTYLTYNTNNVICSNTIIHTSNPATYYVATGISYSTVCSNTKSAIATSVNDDLSVSKTSSYLYPNPSSDVLNVILKEKTTGKITLNIYDEKGTLMESNSFDNTAGQLSKSLNVKALSAGLYTLQILAGENKTYMKFVKVD